MEKFSLLSHELNSPRRGDPSQPEKHSINDCDEQDANLINTLGKCHNPNNVWTRKNINGVGESIVFLLEGNAITVAKESI